MINNRFVGPVTALLSAAWAFAQGALHSPPLKNAFFGTVAPHRPLPDFTNIAITPLSGYDSSRDIWEECEPLKVVSRDPISKRIILE